jgi:hypothetical protein
MTTSTPDDASALANLDDLAMGLDKVLDYLRATNAVGGLRRSNDIAYSVIGFSRPI